MGVYAATPRSDRSRPGATPRFRGGPPGGMSPTLEWEMPYGLRMPMGAYALAASRHMAVYGTTAEQLAQIRGRHPGLGGVRKPCRWSS